METTVPDGARENSSRRNGVYETVTEFGWKVIAYSLPILTPVVHCVIGTVKVGCKVATTPNKSTTTNTIWICSSPTVGLLPITRTLIRVGPSAWPGSSGMAQSATDWGNRESARKEGFKTCKSMTLKVGGSRGSTMTYILTQIVRRPEIPSIPRLACRHQSTYSGWYHTIQPYTPITHTIYKLFVAISLKHVQR